MTDTSGQPFDFAQATAGKLTYLFFGYTHCPDTCPTTMANLGVAVRAQPRRLQGHVAVVFVSVDPTRDTGPMIRSWLDQFNPAFVGLTGTEAQIATIEQQAGVPLAQPEGSPGTSYSVSHSTLVFAYSPDGLAHAVYSEGFNGRDYAHDMPILVSFRAHHRPNSAARPVTMDK